MKHQHSPAQADSLVTIHGGVPVTTTHVIAEKFGKPHNDVLKVVRAVIADCPEEFRVGNFSQSSYTNAQGKAQPMYELTEKSFALVAMGFTGERFIRWKIAFLDEFERRGRELAAPVVRPGQVEALRLRRVAEALAAELMRAKPERRKLLRYRKMGLSVREIGRLTGIGQASVRREITLFETCGMLDVSPRLEQLRITGLKNLKGGAL